MLIRIVLSDSSGTSLPTLRAAIEAISTIRQTPAAAHNGTYARLHWLKILLVMGE
jgi:hypothetical protein